MDPARPDRDEPRGAGVWGVVLAAGGGRRFGAAKQFSMLGEDTLVERAVAAAVAACEGVVLVLPPQQAWDGSPVEAVVAGASHRSGSVRAALEAIPASAEIIVVHGAAHPLASTELFLRVIAAVRSGADAAAPGLVPSDVVARVDGEDLETLVGRDDVRTLQTPAAFRATLLRDAHRQGTEANEDVELVLALGAHVRVVPGEPWNVHVVTTDDLALARWWDRRLVDRT